MMDESINILVPLYTINGGTMSIEIMLKNCMININWRECELALTIMEDLIIKMEKGSKTDLHLVHHEEEEREGLVESIALQ
jgi:hypothetical protein